ncbi:MAG: hypothetical protein E7376_02235 [Clostridiales bacterium]|nr:hypothetical protein [Clostridiales bacterium]
MLSLMQRARLAQKKKDLKLSSKQLSELLGIKYGTLTMVLCGSYSNAEVEKILLNWLKSK